MTLINMASIGGKIGLEALKGTRKQSVELFGYDFVRLFTHLTLYFALAWVIEIVMKIRVHLEDPANQRSVGLGFLGIGGVIIDQVFRHFENQDVQDGNIQQIPVNDFVRKLFKDGYEIGGVTVKYWDIIKAGSVIIIANEYFKFKELSELNGSKPNETTLAIFGLLMFAMGIITIPKFTSQLKQVVNK